MRGMKRSFKSHRKSFQRRNSRSYKVNYRQGTTRGGTRL